MCESATTMVMSSVNGAVIEEAFDNEVKHYNMDNIKHMEVWINDARAAEMAVEVESVVLGGVVHSKVLVEGNSVASGRTAYLKSSHE